MFAVNMIELLFFFWGGDIYFLNYFKMIPFFLNFFVLYNWKVQNEITIWLYRLKSINSSNPFYTRIILFCYLIFSLHCISGVFFYRVTEFAKMGKMCRLNLFRLFFFFCYLKVSNSKQNHFIIISANWIICDVKMIAKKTEIYTIAKFTS